MEHVGMGTEYRWMLVSRGASLWENCVFPRAGAESHISMCGFYSGALNQSSEEYPFCSRCHEWLLEQRFEVAEKHREDDDLMASAEKAQGGANATVPGWLDEVASLLGDEALGGETPVDVVQRLVRNGGGKRSANNPHDPSGTLCEPVFSALARMEHKKRDEIRHLCERLARDVDDGKTDGVVEAIILDDLSFELRALQCAPNILRSVEACNRRTQ